MARKLTDKLQINGYRLLVQRIEQAFISRDVRGLPSPFSKQAQAFALGLGVAALILGAALVWSFISPASRPGDAKILATKEGSRYVVVDNVVHPVTNLASARLIAGENASVKTVSDKELAKYPRGQLMGIPSAPDEMSARTDDESRWVVCSQFDATSELSLTETANARTVVIAGDDAVVMGQRAVGADRAVLVRRSGSTADEPTAGQAGHDIWLLYRGQRIELSDTSDDLRSTLQITDNQVRHAIPVTSEFLDSVPARAVWQKPTIADEGDESKAVSGQRIGAVVVTKGAEGRQQWLITDSGVQRIGPFVAALMINGGAEVVDSGVSAKTMAEQAQVSVIDFSDYPTQVPRIDTSADTVCLDWSRRGQATATSRILAGAGVPMADIPRRQAVTLLPAKNSTPQTDFFYTTPGQGWVVAASGATDESHTEGQLWWVADTGVRSALGSSGDTDAGKLLSTLGVKTVVVQRVPWSILRLLPEGNTLSPEAAMTLHAMIPPDMAQGVAPDMKGLN